MLATFLSQPVVWGTSILEVVAFVVACAAILPMALSIRKYIQCQEEGCRKIGLHPHGHLRFCGIHHPLTPDDGKITAEHVAETTQRLTP